MDWPAVHRALAGLQAKGCSLELAESLAPDVAAALREEIAEALSVLDPLPAPGIAQPEVLGAVCKAADRCLSLVGKAELTAATAEVVREGLAILANVLPPAEALPAEGMPADALTVLEGFSSDLDALAVQLFVGLCRVEAVLAYGNPEAASFFAEVKHYRALQGIAVWVLAVLVRAFGHERLTGRWLWEWASRDPFVLFLLSKGLLSVGKVGSLMLDDGGLNYGIDTGDVPVDLQALQGVILSAVLGLASPDVAFMPTLAGHAFADQVDIGERNRDLQRHRSRLAAAAVEVGFVEVLAGHLAGALEPAAGGQPQGGRPPWPLLVASFLAALASPAPSPQEPETEGALSEEYWWMQGSRTHFGRELSKRSAHIWLLLQAVPEAVSYWEAQPGGAAQGLSLRGFLADCAAIAHASPPSSSGCQDFLRSCLRGGTQVSSRIRGDARALAGLVTLAANAGLRPGIGALDEALQESPPELAVQVIECIHRWRGPVRSISLAPWVDRLTEVAARAGQVAAAEAVVTRPEEGPSAPAEAEPPPGLRSLLEGAPPELCCAIDGRLLVDPVRSPHGHVFERSVLERSLAASGGRCPVTGQPLALEQCPRAPELRKRAVQWVRQRRLGASGPAAPGGVQRCR